MILIYVNKLTNRIQYTFQLIFKDLLGTDFEITTDQAAFKASNLIKINYGKEDLSNGIFIAAEQLLLSRRIEHITVESSSYNGQPTLFPTYYRTSALPFDPFAATFYMVSRYEEYFAYKKDKYGRFDASQSIAETEGFLQRPVVNYWAKIVVETIQKEHPEFLPTYTNYSFTPTIDIDAAWAYRHKGLFRTAGAYTRDLLNQNFSDIKQRTRVLLGRERDPFDTYEFQLNLQKKYKLHPIYFILFADYGHNDKNISVRNNAFQKLITLLADYSEIGIHPSYNSNSDFGKLTKEINSLNGLLNREITKSRQHFLKLTFPDTYRNLISLEITDDYTMGFAEKPGFRAGIANPFFFYDLDLDSATNLRVHPFMFMEGSLADYMNLEAEEAMEHIRPLIDETKAVGGEFICLWHNESLNNQKRWKGWHTIYEETIKYGI